MRADIFRLSLLAALALAAAPTAADAGTALRVCATSDNFPFSDRAGRGFENKLAELVASALGRKLAYTWWPARENFLDRTLKAGACDLVMGVPLGLGGVATTRAYYRSGYVFLSRGDARLGLSSISDARLRQLKIGVYLLGDEQTPPAMALSQQGINDNVRGFMTFFDRKGGSSGLINALTDRSLDVAAVWGPLVGYYARRSTVPLAVTPIEATARFAPLTFRFDIAMGVRPGDAKLRAAVDGVIASREPQIRELLLQYGVPLLPAGNGTPGPKGG